ncbi:MAG: glycosyl transferase family 1, partial [Candidatus Melainabacteria bacterium HGW-Melainabacteria-1]
MTDAEWICGWDQVFDGPWERHAGPAQTTFFAQVALAGMPPPLIELIRQQQLEILDWGCALGDALPVLAQAFPASVLSGLDISSRAVARARERYPDWTFESRPLRELGRQLPVVYTSNCLEHFP